MTRVPEPAQSYDRRVSGRPRHDQNDPAGAPVYALGCDPEERDRLRRQAEELRAHSTALLDRVGLEQGGSAIDLGCGPQGVIDLLAERVGPGGRVVGLDFNADNVALAREFARERRLTSVEILEGDARHTGLASSSFDLVHVRTVLVNLPDPAAVVAEMMRLAKPGGAVAALEPDTNLTICHPPHPAWARLVEIFNATYFDHGADPSIGRRLPELFRQAGVVDIGVDARAEIYPIGHSRRAVRADLLRSMRSKIVERGLAGAEELAEVDREVRKHLNDPHTLILQVLFLAWGRKPTS